MLLPLPLPLLLLLLLALDYSSTIYALAKDLGFRCFFV